MTGTLFERISAEYGPKHIAVIGSGGKTGTILKLAEEARRLGKKVLITTTTKMWIPEAPVAQTADEAREQLKTRSVVWAGTVDPELGKIRMLPEEEFGKLDGLADLILTEADGSKGLPLKYPAGNEPVIPETADHLILVLGLDCLDRPLCEVCHHWERIPLSMIRMEEETVSYKTAARLLTDGYIKRMPPLPYTILLNASIREPETEKIKGLSRLLPPGRVVIRTKEGFLTPEELDDRKRSQAQAEKMRIGAILMAAGLGKRFGGDKLFARIGDSTLIEITLQAIPDGVFEKVIVVAKDERILSAAAEHGFGTVVNPAPEEGISGTIRLGTEAISDLDAAMYLVCDQPYLTKETIQKLAEAAEEDPEKIIVPESEGRWGNPCVFPGRFFPELMALQGEKGGKSVIRNHPECVKTVCVPQEELLDIDKKEDIPDRLCAGRE